MNTDRSKFDRILTKIPEEKINIANDLIENLIFMEHVLDTLKKDIEKYGNVVETLNGSQRFLKENPALKSYSTMIQRYGTLNKQLTDLIPKTDRKTASSPILEFMSQ